MLRLLVLFVFVAVHVSAVDSDYAAGLFHARISNAGEIHGSSSNSWTALKWGDYVSHRHRDVFSHSASTGEITFLRAGAIFCSLHLDGSAASQIYGRFLVDGTERVRTTRNSANGHPNRLETYLAWKVSVGTKVLAQTIPNDWSAFATNANHTDISCIWAANGEAYVAGQTSSTSFSTSIFNSNSTVFSGSGNQVTIGRAGMVIVALQPYIDSTSSYGWYYLYQGGTNMGRTIIDSSGSWHSAIVLGHLNMAQNQQISWSAANIGSASTNGRVMAFYTGSTDIANTADTAGLSNRATFASSSSSAYAAMQYNTNVYGVWTSSQIANSNAVFTAQADGIVSVRFTSDVKPSTTFNYAPTKLVYDGVEIGATRNPRGDGGWSNTQRMWMFPVQSGKSFSILSLPSHVSSMDNWDWGHMSVALFPERNNFLGVCANGTENDPEVLLPSPTLQTPSFSSNNYVFGFNVDERYESVRVQFGAEADGNSCNYDSSDGTGGDYWGITSDGECTTSLVMSRPAQDTLATCAFTRSETTTDSVYTKRISVVTNQTRSVTYQQAFRNFVFQQIRTTHFTLTVTVPKNVAFTHTGVQVTGNITTLQDVSSVAVDVSVSPYHVKFDVITSSQAPYQLQYLNFTSVSTHLADSTTVATPLPACQGSSPGDSCTQVFTLDAIDISTGCETKTSLNDEVEVFFSVGCKSSFTGNCQTPQPAVVGMSFTLSSSQYCPQIENVVLSATLETYRDVGLQDATWSAGSKTTQFVVGSTVFGQIDVTVGENAATLSSTTLRTLKTYATEEVTIYDSGTNHATVENTEFTGSASSTRFSVVLANGVSVSIDPVADAAQFVQFSAVVDVVFTTTSTKGSNAVLQSWQSDHSARTRRIHVSRQGEQSAPATSTVSVLPAGNEQAAAGGASSSSMSTAMVTGIGAVAALAVVAVAYRMGVSRPPPEDAGLDKEVAAPMMDLAKSASTTSLETDLEASASS